MGAHLPVRPSWGMASTPIQLGQHVSEGIYLSIQTSWVQPAPVWGESLGIEQKQGECTSHGLPSCPGRYAPPPNLVLTCERGGAPRHPTQAGPRSSNPPGAW